MSTIKRKEHVRVSIALTEAEYNQLDAISNGNRSWTLRRLISEEFAREQKRKANDRVRA